MALLFIIWISTKYKYQAAKFFVIFDFNHRCQKSEMTVDYTDGFIYPEHIRKIAIFWFLSIYLQSSYICLSDNSGES
jgi:predicted metal-dependent peptidase